jgi:hypothetical protein
VRTTVTFDDDVAALLKKEMRKSGEPFKRVVNRAVRSGLSAPLQPRRKPFKVTPINLGLPPDLSYDNVEELLDYLEGPFRR